eukprot:5095694-Pyramimonas_sp.AAC.1
MIPDFGVGGSTPLTLVLVCQPLIIRHFFNTGPPEVQTQPGSFVDDPNHLLNTGPRSPGIPIGLPRDVSEPRN